MTLLTDSSIFIRAWLRQPMRTGAVMPSGSSLARLITAELQPDAGPVIELGPGTGALTRCIMARGVPEADVILVERCPEFARLLRQRYPAAQMHEIDVTHMRRQRGPWNRAAAQAVISGLPLLNMGLRAQWGIVSTCFGALREDGAFYQFTYTTRCPIARPVLDRLGLRAQRIGGTFLNLPPASVYKISRR